MFYFDAFDATSALPLQFIWQRGRIPIVYYYYSFRGY